MNEHTFVRPQKKPLSVATPSRGRKNHVGASRAGVHTLQRIAVGCVPDNAVPSIVHDVLCLPSQPMDPNTRAFMESRFGYDFSQVRVHTDARAADSARAVNARAYTVGQDIVFGAGQYALGTTAGKRLLAHELTHTTQQCADAQAVQIVRRTPDAGGEESSRELHPEPSVR